MKLLFTLVCLMIAAVNTSAQWVQTPGIPLGGGLTAIDIANNGNIVATTASFNYPGGQLGGMRMSSNNGASWVSVYSCYTARTIKVGSGSHVYVSAWNYPSSTEAIWKSTNNGEDYLGGIYFIGSNNNIFAIEVTDNNQTFYIGTRTGVRKSTNGGSVFTPVNNGLPSDAWVFDLAYDSASNLLAAGTSKGLYITSNGGASWQMPSGITASDTIPSLTFINTQGDGQDLGIIAANSNGDIHEIDPDALAGAIIYSFFAIEPSQVKVVDDLVVGLVLLYLGRPPGFDNSSNPGFYFSTNGGNNWTEMSGGLPSSPKMSASAYKVIGGTGKVFAGVYDNMDNGSRIFTANSPVGITPISSEIPAGYSLSQNYPNPFNPETKIKFAIPKTGLVNISVYDAMGRKVSELVNQNLQPGTYEADWNAASLTSGTYFYTIQANSFYETKKMLLVK